MPQPSSRASLLGRGGRVVNAALRRRGVELRRAAPAVAAPGAAFRERSKTVERRHRVQTLADVDSLRAKYREPVFGRVRVWDLVERLAQCVDPTDCRLYCTNQQIHVLQILEGMERDGVADADLVLAALIHDLGKLLLLTDEDPANVVCMNTPIGDYADGVGLDACTFQWNHDEFGWSRFKDHVPEHVAWLIRYHSLELDQCERLMDERDRCWAERYLQVLARYDHGTKSPYHLPAVRLDAYRDVIEHAFPTPIVF